MILVIFFIKILRVALFLEEDELPAPIDVACGGVGAVMTPGFSHARGGVSIQRPRLFR